MSEDDQVIEVRDITWDLSNLCVVGTGKAHVPAEPASLRKARQRRRSRPFHHLYPSKEALHQSMPDLSSSTVDDLFSSCRVESKPPSRSDGGPRLATYLDRKPSPKPSEDDVPSVEFSSHSQSTSTYPHEDSSSSYEYETSQPYDSKAFLIQRQAEQLQKYAYSKASQRTLKKPVPQETQVEVSPGVFLPLRGSEETLKALRQGDTTVLQCFLCQVELCCVCDCEWVLCPDCRTLTPVSSDPTDSLHKSLPDLRHPHGVGLGLKTSMLATHG